MTRNSKSNPVQNPFLFIGNFQLVNFLSVGGTRISEHACHSELDRRRAAPRIAPPNPLEAMSTAELRSKIERSNSPFTRWACAKELESRMSYHASGIGQDQGVFPLEFYPLA